MKLEKVLLLILLCLLLGLLAYYWQLHKALPGMSMFEQPRPGGLLSGVSFALLAGVPFGLRMRRQR